MTDPILLRRRVRTVLSALPNGRRASEQLLFDTIRPDFPDLKLAELLAALNWNLKQAYVDYRRSTDDERNEWFLTPEGKQKEGL
jgi:uncharacterized protein (DUF433 family)